MTAEELAILVKVVIAVAVAERSASIAPFPACRLDSAQRWSA
jgi:hypothetical protein